MNGLLGESERVLAGIDGWCERAASVHVDLVLFPELVHGHCTPKTRERAEAVPEGANVRRLGEIARRHDLMLSIGLSAKKRDIVYNTQVLVGPDGYTPSRHDDLPDILRHRRHSSRKIQANQDARRVRSATRKTGRCAVLYRPILQVEEEVVALPD